LLILFTKKRLLVFEHKAFNSFFVDTCIEAGVVERMDLNFQFILC